MEEYTKMLSSPIWWFTVVIVGILVNLIAFYIKKWIDRAGTRISGRWRRISEEKEAKRKYLVDLIRDNPQEEITFNFLEIRNRLRSIVALLMGTTTIVCGITFLLFLLLFKFLKIETGGSIKILFSSMIGLGFLAFIFGILSFHEVISQNKILFEARLGKKDGEK